MEFEAIWKRARADLLIPTPRAEPDVFLWEHSARVARTAQHLVELPAIRECAPDVAAVVAAALYHEAGWASRGRAGEHARLEVLHGTLSEGDREEAARMMERTLRDLLPSASLERAIRAVRTFRNRDAELIEARVVADAMHLQGFGVLSLWGLIRRGLLEGRGVQSVLDGWQRKKEYRFWTARLDDSFHFDVVRELARRRLERMERLMAELEEEHNVEDLASNLHDARAARP